MGLIEAVVILGEFLRCFSEIFDEILHIRCLIHENNC